MKKLVASLFIITSVFSSSSASAEKLNTLNNSKTFNKSKSSLENFSFNYFSKYTGPSLGGGYAAGTTYNRFDGGKNQNGKRNDTTGSTQLYQSFKLGYDIGGGKVLAIGHTFQENLTDNVEFEWANGAKGTRSNGQSNNNNRLSLWLPNILAGNSYSLSTSVFYEAPTTESSRANDMLYGIGIQPTLSINSSISGLYHGITASLERYVYPDDQFNTYLDISWCKEPGYTCDGVTPIKTGEVRRQAAKANIGAFVNYSLTEKLTLKSAVEFDWDQTGSQVATTQFGNNMDNIGKIGTKYQFNKNISSEAFIIFSIEDPEAKKSALGASLDLRI